MRNRTLKNASAALALLLLSSCGGGSTSGLNIYVTDAPVDTASSIVLSFSQLVLDGPNVPKPQTISFNPVSSLNVYQFQGGLSGSLALQVPIATGHYTDLKITLAANSLSAQSALTLPDGTHILYIPDNKSDIVDVPVDFQFTSGQTLNLMLDFDMRKSIVQDPADPTKYILIPSVRGVVIEDTGSIVGRVDNSLITCTTPAVYVYPGTVTSPTDVDSSAPAGTLQPLATALVGLNTTSGDYNFTSAFLPAGTYTVAFTCQASQDVANQPDNIAFTATTTAVVTAKGSTLVSLQ